MRRCLIALVAVVSMIVPANADTKVLVAMDDLYGDIGQARSITLCAFSLSPRGRMTRMLIAAAQRGAAVTIALDRDAFGEAADMNRETAEALSAAGVHVHYSRGASHLKAVVVDGSRIYLSDRNFTSRGTNEIVIADPFAGDRLLVERAMLGTPGSNDHLWLRKADAIHAEAELLASGRSSNIGVETESFGAGTEVYQVLMTRARHGDRVHLLVAEREYQGSASEQRAVAALRDAGAEVRVGGSDEKIAIEGERSWAGSANLTQGLADQIDFGFRFDDLETTNALARAFIANWNEARSV